MQQKLPVWRVIRETFDYLGDHGGRTLAMAPQLVAILIVGVCLGVYLDQMAVARQSMLLQLAGWLVTTACPVMLAVAWHRRILLNEYARGGIATGKPERMYFIVAVILSASFFVLSIARVVIAVLMSGPEGVSPLGIALQLFLVLLPAYFVGHFFLALPQAALTGRVDVRRITALTRGNKWRFLAVSLLPVPILLLMEAVRGYLLRMPLEPGLGSYLYGALMMLVTTIISVTTMSVCYRILALPASDDAPEAQARETAVAEG
ncbi:hypothetical protein [Achromobacter sp.]|uniref:hypothetical protein n=1 Tax=Achromobacter sp. TaxID=134375 RepID=UPI0028B206D9|nr:hypothetical protein [Achromobacter sp.]